MYYVIFAVFYAIAAGILTAIATEYDKVVSFVVAAVSFLVSSCMHPGS